MTRRKTELEAVKEVQEPVVEPVVEGPGPSRGSAWQAQGGAHPTRATGAPAHNETDPEKVRKMGTDANPIYEGAGPSRGCSWGTSGQTRN